MASTHKIKLKVSLKTPLGISIEVVARSKKGENKYTEFILDKKEDVYSLKEIGYYAYFSEHSNTATLSIPHENKDLIIEIKSFFEEIK